MHPLLISGSEELNICLRQAITFIIVCPIIPLYVSARCVSCDRSSAQVYDEAISAYVRNCESYRPVSAKIVLSTIEGNALLCYFWTGSDYLLTFL
jgi:hypothetical protein